MGVEWAFKIESQKISKYSKQKSHCWQSENYNGLGKRPFSAMSSDDDEPLPDLVVKR